jgi:hypothetical protein
VLVTHNIDEAVQGENPGAGRPPNRQALVVGAGRYRQQDAFLPAATNCANYGGAREMRRGPGLCGYLVIWECWRAIARPVFPPPTRVLLVFARHIAGDLGWHTLVSAGRVVCH